MITNSQKALIHVAKAQLHLTADMYEAILREQGGVTSSIDLTNESFERVMHRFIELGFDAKTRHHRMRHDPRPAGPVTPAQQALIRELYDQLGWPELERQIGLNKRVCHKNWPQTRTDANKVIEALKAMIARGRKAS